MNNVWLVLVVLIMAPMMFGATIDPPCEETSVPSLSGVSYPNEPLAPRQPVPSTGSFTCRGIIFDSFSNTILDGGLIGASFVRFPPGVGQNVICPSACGTGSWLFDIVRFTVQPVDPSLGFSFRATGSFNTPLAFMAVPPLNHVTSGNPTVTANFDGIDLTASAVQGSGYVRVPGDWSVLVVVEPGDIGGGTISAFSVVFVTPEPSTWALSVLGLGLLGWRCAVTARNARGGDAARR